MSRLDNPNSILYLILGEKINPSNFNLDRLIINFVSMVWFSVIDSAVNNVWKRAPKRKENDESAARIFIPLPKVSLVIF